jgi:hypothetical protein
MSATPAPPRVAAAIAQAAEISGVSPAEIRSASVVPRVVAARWQAWRVLSEAGFGLAPIGRAWGCDHTTILYAKRQNWTVTRAAPFFTAKLEPQGAPLRIPEPPS